jgi:hypothetical protein
MARVWEVSTSHPVHGDAKSHVVQDDKGISYVHKDGVEHHDSTPVGYHDTRAQDGSRGFKQTKNTSEDFVQPQGSMKSSHSGVTHTRLPDASGDARQVAESIFKEQYQPEGGQPIETTI